METFSGRAVPVGDTISVLDIDIDDILVSLSRINRYLGHTSRPISVLEHSVIVAELLMSRGYSVDIILAGLMHDAKEAYIGDIPTPVKRWFEMNVPGFDELFKELERHIDAAIAAMIGIDVDLFYCDEVKQADIDILMLEASKLCATGGIDWNFSRKPTYKMGELAWEEYHADMAMMPEQKLRDFVRRRYNTLVTQVAHG